MAAIHERQQVRREVQLRVTHPTPYPTISHPIRFSPQPRTLFSSVRCSPQSLRTLFSSVTPYAVLLSHSVRFSSQPRTLFPSVTPYAFPHNPVRCSPQSLRTLFSSVTPCAVLLSHSVRCSSQPTHLLSALLAVCKKAESHTEPSARLSGMTWRRPGYWSGILQSAVRAGPSGGSAKGCWPTTWL